MLRAPKAFHSNTLWPEFEALADELDKDLSALTDSRRGERSGRRGGDRRSPMPDFYVGAHAVVARMELLTRDATRYRMYYPALAIVAPRRPRR